MLCPPLVESSEDSLSFGLVMGVYQKVKYRRKEEGNTFHMEGLNGNLGKLHNCGTSRSQLGQASLGLEGYMGSFDIYLIGNIKSLRIPIALLYSYGDLPIHSIFLIFCSLCFFPSLSLSFQVNYLLFFHEKTGSLQFWEQCPC